VLARVAGILSDGRVSIATVEQSVAEPTGPDEAGSARLVIGTHTAVEQDLSETVMRLAEDDVVERVVSVLRVEGD
jgi:homoserine dehydrogenase